MSSSNDKPIETTEKTTFPSNTMENTLVSESDKYDSLFQILNKNEMIQLDINKYLYNNNYIDGTYDQVIEAIQNLETIKYDILKDAINTYENNAINTYENNAIKNALLNDLTPKSGGKKSRKRKHNKLKKKRKSTRKKRRKSNKKHR